jgi:hypothetical protein
MPNDPTAENILEILGDLENYPEEALVAYQEFERDERTYYFTPGGFLYRKDPGSEEIGGFFCGYLTDEAWHYRTAGSPSVSSAGAGGGRGAPLPTLRGR